MKVLHVNAFDAGGGAARAAMRLHAGLRGQGVDSRFLTLKPSSGEAGVFSPLRKRQQLAAFAKRQAAARIAALQKTPTNPIIHSLGLFPSGLGRWINASDVDVVNLHWVCAETLSIREIARIEKPIVWTMHDMWPFMGAEHYDDLDHPGRWKAPYTRANRPANATGPGIDAWVWARKARAWAGRTFHLVAPSRWLAGCAADSALMGHQPRTVIANPLDTDAFAPIDRVAACRMLGLPENRKLVLFGAFGATSDRRKGYDLLVAALQAFERNHGRADVEVMMFGGQTDGEIPGVGLKSHFLGTFHDDLSLRVVYSAADVFVAPSRQDNLPNTVVEAAACGVPTAAFDIGGMSDIIDHGETGMLAPAFGADGLAAGIAWMLNTPFAREKVRAAAVAKFSREATVPAYLSLYRRVLGA
ncbi:glycosyltransferase [Acuticoccus kandeliae]|uniref:glycosyltransferase n=1 Tax=Acuticoccus kandeliae TaxID=2073160 RepID=UPI00130045FE|nr:glycosyltransferase [Acuticoccus kandeliae]